MVCLYFGLPGAGKTTVLCSIAYRFLMAKKPKYKYIYSNVYFGNKPPFDQITYISSDDLGVYEITEGLILLDEASLDFDSRDFKNFSKAKSKFFMKHRHESVDVILFTQIWDSVDRKIRGITDRVYYVNKSKLFGHWFSCYYRIPYDIIIPDPKRSSGEKLGEIIQGYCKPTFIQRLFFTRRIYRPKYYQFFDSWERTPYPPLPQGRIEIVPRSKKVLRTAVGGSAQNLSKNDA